VLLGRADFRQAVDHGDIQLDGTPVPVRAFPTWLGVSRSRRHPMKREGPRRDNAGMPIV